MDIDDGIPCLMGAYFFGLLIEVRNEDFSNDMMIYPLSIVTMSNGLRKFSQPSNIE